MLKCSLCFIISRVVKELTISKLYKRPYNEESNSEHFSCWMMLTLEI